MDKPAKSAAKGRVFWIAGLVVLTAALVIAVLGLGSRAAGGPHVVKEGGPKDESVSYTGYVSTAPSAQDAVEEWKYVIRANSECNADVFADTAGYNGNLTKIVTGSNVYASTSLEEIERFDGGYICFQASFGGGSEDLKTEWFGIQMRITDAAGHYEAGWPEVRPHFPAAWDAYTVAQKIESNPYDCPEPVMIDAEDGRCLVGGETMAVNGNEIERGPGTIVGSRGGGSAGFWIIITNYDGTYVARASASANVQNWRYIVWDEPVCNEITFQGYFANDTESLVRGSNSYDTSQAEGSKLYDICFAARGENGKWQYAGANFAAVIPDYWTDVCADRNNPPQLGPIPDHAWCTEDDSRTPHVGIRQSLGLAGYAAERFDDISVASSYAEAVGFLLEREITSGCDENYFCPNQKLTRGQFVTFLYRLLDEPKHPQSGSELFDDVEDGSYFDEAVGWAHHAGITTGCDADSFCPGQTVTRAHAATFLHRLVGEPEVPLLFNAGDFDEQDYYYGAARWAMHHGIVYTCGGGGGPTGPATYYFCPGEPVTRGEAAEIIYNFAITSESWGTTDLPIEIK